MASKSKKNGNGKTQTAQDEQDKFPPPKVERYRRSLRVELKPEEIAESADRAAQMIADRDSKDEEQKAQAKHAKAIIEGLEGEIRRLSNEVRTKATYRDVECDRIFDLRTKTLTEKRTDTGEVLFERPLTETECQRELDLPPPGGDLDSDFDEAPAP